MAAHERLVTKTSIASLTLLQKLAIVLPKDVSFKIYHLSTPPTRTSAIYSAPSGNRPDRTYCESHFLTVSISTHAKDDAELKEVLVYAIEILIYSTAYDTTFFVSKADSTGYLHLLDLVKGSPSPIRDITATFLRHLVEGHQRQNLRSVISLFARAQDQYLFPGSIEYDGKHVLDDRELVRWWCRVLDPLIEHSKSGTVPDSLWDTVKGYLVVPGLDSHETRSYIPKRSIPNTSWTIGNPLNELSRHADEVPPRCLIPHFPDDPKARFLDELDEETARGRSNSNGEWKSVKTIAQFWDMMAFRQECSAGRMVGFIWIVFTPKIQHQPTIPVLGDSQSTVVSFRSPKHRLDSSQLSIPDCLSQPITPATSVNASSQIYATSSPWTRDDDLTSQQSDRSSKPLTPTKKKKKKLSGPIIPRQPRIKTENKNYLLERPESTAYYVWHPESRGQIIVDEIDYKRITELLLRLDFANLKLAASSSARWVNEVRSGARGSMSDAWGQTVTGTKAVELRTQASAAGGVQTMNIGLIRKKRKPGADEPKVTPVEPISQSSVSQVNLLSTGMIRKKAKV
jgi:regulator of Ty1 transposition protein 109